MSGIEDTPTRVIVVGVDGSPSSEHALRWAVAEAQRCGGGIHTITVRRPDDLLPGASFALRPHGRKPARNERSLRESLHSQVATIAPAAPVTESVVTGDPATELCKASENADLLVLGSHGYRALTEVLLGSVAADCVRHAQCPVVLIPAGLAR